MGSLPIAAGFFIIHYMAAGNYPRHHISLVHRERLTRWPSHVSRGMGFQTFVALTILILKFVGTIVTDLNSIQDCTLTMPLKLNTERLFFQGVAFYQLKKIAEYKTHYQRIDGTDFSMLTTLFHPKINLQMSALSTYKPSVTCYSFPVPVHFISETTKL
jgi:hypothetical protein